MSDNATSADCNPVVAAVILDAIEAQWIARVRAQQKPTKGARYEKEEVEFFAGAMSALVAVIGDKAIPPRWYFPLISGRRVIDEARFKA